MKYLWILLCLFGLLCGPACSFDKGEHGDFCNEDTDCASDSCVQGLCIAESGGGDGDGDGDGDGEGSDCVDGDPPEACYDGDEGTEELGECRGGERVCVGGQYTQCLGQVLPEDEGCDGMDNDCDDEVDEIEDASCDTKQPGICGEGALVCQGSFAVCESVKTAENETCNASDDYCDGVTDEVTPETCYPAMVGCRMMGGVISCQGLCTTGETACEGGTDVCEGAVVPGKEKCTGAGGLAADEDCDGQIDEGCDCTPGAKLECYAGPMGTEGEGACKAGQQTCGNDNTWGACKDQRLPRPETCLNQGEDDDCDGDKDNIALLGLPCIDEDKKGLCRVGEYQCQGAKVLPQCVGADPEQEVCDSEDHDCDGDPLNGFDLNSDPNNCGECEMECSNGQSCCGECIKTSELDEDPENCGGCGIMCGDGQYCCQGDCMNEPSVTLPPLPGSGEPAGDGNLCECTEDCGALWCCGTECVDILNDPDNCGACGVVCAPGQVGEFRQCHNGQCSGDGSN